MAENERQADFYDAPEEEQSRIENTKTAFKGEPEVIEKETSGKAKKILVTSESREIKKILDELPKGLVMAEGERRIKLDELKRRLLPLVNAENDNDLPFRVEKATLKRLCRLIENEEKKSRDSAEN